MTTDNGGKSIYKIDQERKQIWSNPVDPELVENNNNKERGPDQVQDLEKNM